MTGSLPEFADVAPDCDDPSLFDFPYPFPLVNDAGNVSIASAWSIRATCV